MKCPNCKTPQDTKTHHGHRWHQCPNCKHTTPSTPQHQKTQNAAHRIHKYLKNQHNLNIDPALLQLIIQEELNKE